MLLASIGMKPWLAGKLLVNKNIGFIWLRDKWEFYSFSSGDNTSYLELLTIVAKPNIVA
jgi:hypothetical protein